MFNNYPYTNFHELNLEYFINHFKEIFAEWENLYNELQNWKTGTTEELEAWKTAVENDLTDREAALRAELEEWKSETNLDIEEWELSTIADLNEWKDAAEAVFEAIRIQAANSATAAQTAQTAAETAQTAAETAQSAAEDAADAAEDMVNSISASASQIEQNTDDITDLKTQLNNIIRDETTVYEPDQTNTNYFYNTAGNTIGIENGEFRLSYANDKSDNYSIPVNEGDNFIITSTGQTAGAYAFIGTIHETYANVVSRFAVNETVTNEEVTIPSGVTYLIVNNFNVGNGLVKKVVYDPLIYESDIAPIESDIEQLQADTEQLQADTEQLQADTEQLQADIIPIKSEIEQLKAENVKPICSKDASTVYIYIPTSNKKYYISYKIVKVYNATQYASGWRLSEIKLRNLDKTSVENGTIMGTGEWETALLIPYNSSTVYLGLGNHGYEEQVNGGFTLFIDGKEVEESDIFDEQAFEEIQLINKLTMLDPRMTENPDIIGYHTRINTINGIKKTITIENKLEFTNADSIPISQGFLFMATLQREYPANSGNLMTDKFIDNVDYIMTDCSTSMFNPSAVNHGVGEDKPNVTEYKFWGEYFELWGYAKIIRRETNAPRIDGGEQINQFLPSNYVKNYENQNKIYMSICKNGNVIAGDIWRMTTEFFLDCGYTPTV